MRSSSERLRTGKQVTFCTFALGESLRRTGRLGPDTEDLAFLAIGAVGGGGSGASIISSRPEMDRCDIEKVRDMLIDMFID
jgi:hypothetical protein